MNDDTLGGYLTLHQRAPAFEGLDGEAYSVSVYVDDTPGDDGRFGGALLFIRWSAAGDQPTGHLETDHLVFGATAREAEDQIRALTLYQVKDHLDRLVTRARELPSW